MSESLFPWYFENKSGENSSLQGFDYENCCCGECDAVYSGGMIINISEVNSASKFRLVPTIKNYAGFVF